MKRRRPRFAQCSTADGLPMSPLARPRPRPIAPSELEQAR